MGTVTLASPWPNVRLKDSLGFLVCSCMPGGLTTNWKTSNGEYKPCDHVFKAINLGLDAKREEPFDGDVCIPMRPTPINGHFFTIQLTAHAEQARNGMTPFFAGNEIVGYLDTGEGRRAMRLVAYEWLRNKYREVSVCESTTHTRWDFGPQERVRLNLDSTNPEVLANVAAINATGKCWNCMFDSGDDLIPDV